MCCGRERSRAGDGERRVQPAHLPREVGKSAILPSSLGAMSDTTDDVRVLSLLSATTEIVHRLGCAHLLVGRSHGCDDPPLATTKPIMTAPRVDPAAGQCQKFRRPAAGQLQP